MQRRQAGTGSQAIIEIDYLENEIAELVGWHAMQAFLSLIAYAWVRAVPAPLLYPSTPFR